MKFKFLILALVIPFGAQAVENGTYKCSKSGSKRSLKITIESDKMRMGDSDESISLIKENVWRADSDLKDGWDTKTKVVRNDISITLISDNIQIKGYNREVSTTRIDQIADTDTFRFSQSEISFNAAGKMFDDGEVFSLLCKKK